jgi:hypothetical protein
MPIRRIRLILALVILAISLVLLIWGFWPLLRQNQLLHIYGDSLPALAGKPMELTSEPLRVASIQLTLTEARILTLDWPAIIRLGDMDVVHLTLDVDEIGFSSQKEESPRRITPNLDLYATHSVVAEARLDLPGVQVTPSGMVSQPLLPGQSVKFTWQIRCTQTGKYRGVVWFYLSFAPLDGSAESERAISAQSIEIEAIKLLGLNGETARLGVVGVFMSALLSLPFIEDNLRCLWLRAKKEQCEK